MKPQFGLLVGTNSSVKRPGHPRKYTLAVAGPDTRRKPRSIECARTRLASRVQPIQVSSDSVAETAISNTRRKPRLFGTGQERGLRRVSHAEQAQSEQYPHQPRIKLAVRPAAGCRFCSGKFRHNSRAFALNRPAEPAALHWMEWRWKA